MFEKEQPLNGAFLWVLVLKVIALSYLQLQFFQ